MHSNEHQEMMTDSDIVKLKARAALLFALLSHSRSELQRRDSTINQLEAQLRQQDETITEIMQSKSWRLTAPLRALKRAARRSR
jgi:hypothetical protein